ncbi:hypothetical protein C8Q79DRAFT_967199 [Trametes meyenii]|nr:hypothetical protein C8Q79DRAFT_967199 [Trametes meyenii]
MVKFQAYTVTVGRRTGVFTDWLEVTSSVVGIPGSSYKGYPDCQSALDAFYAAEQRGDVRQVRKASQDCVQVQRTRAQGPREDEPRPGPRTASVTSSSSGRTSRPDRAVRDALIADTLDKVKRERQGGSWISARDGGRRTKTSSDSTRDKLSVARTHSRHTDEPPKPSGSCAIARGHETRNTRPSAQHGRSGTSEPSTSSSPPTAVTVYEHGSDSIPSPRYAQSLSYASDASPLMSVASPMTGSGALAPSDRRSDVSTPSTGVSKTFPADFAIRPRDMRGSKTLAAAAATLLSPSEAAATMGSPVASISEYGTPLSSVEPRFASLRPVLESLPASTAMVRPEATSSSGRADAAAVNDSPSGMSAAQRRKIGKNYSDAAVQVSPPPRPRECTQTEKRTKTVSSQRYATVNTQTSPVPWARATPLRATVSAGDVLDRPGSLCECEHPEHICRVCGLPPRTVPQPVTEHVASPVAVDVVAPELEVIATRPVTPVSSPSAANSVAIPESSPATPSPAARSSSSTSLLLSSPVASSAAFPQDSITPAAPASDHPVASTPLTASPASFHSAMSLPIEAHTPLLGPSERQPDSAAAAAVASFEEGLRVMVRATLARQDSDRDVESSVVLHDTAFDPRSPIQRGTMIPAGLNLEGDTLLPLRPSPLIVPMNSLLFS